MIMLSNFSISNQAGKVYVYSVFAVIVFALGILSYLQISGKHKGTPPSTRRVES